MSFLNLFRNAKEVHEFSAGQVIFNKGDRATNLFVIQAGIVDIYNGDKLLNSLEAGEMLGEMALIDGSSRSATAIARNDCKLAEVDERRFLYMVQETPMFSLQVMRMLVKRLRSSNEYLNAE